MANERFTDLPQASSANLTDIICAVQGYVSPSVLGVSTQMPLQLISNLLVNDFVLSNPGNPNGLVAGQTYQLLWDSADGILYVCTVTGTATTAVWTASNVFATPTLGGTGVSNPPIHTLPVAQGTANFHFLGPLTNGQLLIGATGSDPEPAAPIGGTNITVTPGAGSLSIALTGIVAPANGGTGVNNGSSTITIGGNTAFDGAFTFAGTLTGNTAVTFPTSGTLATTSGLPTPAALTEANDTNVTLSLSGTPATALLQPVEITAGWSGELAISRGGTGASTAATALSNLGALPIAGGTMTGNLILNADPTLPLGAVTKQYADAISAGLEFKNAVVAASTANLNAAYLNGVLGVGATLTNSGTMAAFALDGQSPTVGQRVLIKNQSTAYQNGIYSVTTVGSGSANWVLTRTTDYDIASEIHPGDLVPVENGTVNANSIWLQTATVNTMGMDSITFTLYLQQISVSGTTHQVTVTPSGTNYVISLPSQIQTQGLLDTNALPYLTGTTTASAVNNINIANSATGTAVIASAVGTDTNIDFNVMPKGTGLVILGQAANGYGALVNALLDSNRNGFLVSKAVVNTVNYFAIAGAITGNPPSFQAVGTDAAVAMDFNTSGSTGVYSFRPCIASGSLGTAQAELRLFYCASGINSFYSGLKASASLAASTTWTLPTADGTSGQVMSTNGSGALSFIPPGSVLLAGPTSLAGSSGYTYTSLSSTYSRYIFMLQDVQMTTSGASLYVRMGPVGGIDSGNNYYRSTYAMATNGALTGYATTSGIPEINQPAITVPTGDYLQYFAELYMPSSSFNYKILKSHAILFNPSTNQITEMCVAGYKNTAAVTQIEFLPSTSTFSAGSISIYGMV